VKSNCCDEIKVLATEVYITARKSSRHFGATSTKEAGYDRHSLYGVSKSDPCVAERLASALWLKVLHCLSHRSSAESTELWERALSTPTSWRSLDTDPPSMLVRIRGCLYCLADSSVFIIPTKVPMSDLHSTTTASMQVWWKVKNFWHT
jgi:hypothetical protein